MEKSTDDFYTFNSQNVEIAPVADCSCMYHNGEFAITTCTIDPFQTRRNLAALKN